MSAWSDGPAPVVAVIAVTMGCAVAHDRVPPIELTELNDNRSPAEVRVSISHAVTEPAGSGTLVPGKRADLLVLGANPLEDIRSTRSLEVVVSEGRVVDRRALLADVVTGGPAAAIGDAVVPQCAFGAVDNLGPAVNSPFFEGSPTVSADERTLIFTSERMEGRQDLFTSTRRRAEDPWGEAVTLGPTVNHPTAHDFSVRLSRDGRSLYFASERPGGFGSSDLYVARRASPGHPWEPPENLGPGINTGAFEAFPTPSADGNTLYFNRSTTWDSPDSEIWVTTRANEDEPWGAPERLPEPIRGPGSDFAPAISADGLTLYFASRDRPGNIGLVDIWAARRPSVAAPWGAPENLGTPVNTPQSVAMAPFPSIDGRRLYFMSSRPGGLGGADCEFWDCFDLYVATRTCGDDDPFLRAGMTEATIHVSEAHHVHGARHRGSQET